MGKHRSDMFTPLKLGLMLVNVQVCQYLLLVYNQYDYYCEKICYISQKHLTL